MFSVLELLFSVLELLREEKSPRMEPSAALYGLKDQMATREGGSE
jgi:hypothetical protein